jgi:hypothetical protein
MYRLDEVDRALVLLDKLGSYSAVARETGISRAAVRSWSKGFRPGRRSMRSTTCMRCTEYSFPVPGATEFAYSYLLGLYLGDGTLSKYPRGVFGLRVSLDRAYPVIVAECEAAMAIAMPASKVGRVRSRREQMDQPYSYSRHWPCLFPQHAPGLKHLRPIVLEAWQREILDQHPWRFLRGLIHSDGYRGINTIKHPKKTYRYPRYQFTNHSDDIQGLFCEYCDKVGVQWRQMNRWNISVARRESVALMDRHIGPKR